jgi:bifunctional non-homologous end joining protein LigD
VLLGVDGVSDFDGLHSRKFDAEVQLYAFDALMIEGEDLRASCRSLDVQGQPRPAIGAPAGRHLR